jgi:hypothetical protein
MQAARFLMLTLTASTLLGCASARDRLMGPRPTASKAPSPNVKAVADRYNANSSKLQSIRCANVVIDGKAKEPNGNSQIFTLDAMLAFEKPNNFRMKGLFAGRPEVDLGSNKDEIWCWVKRADPGAVYFCKRDEIGKMQMAIPFQPDWLAEVLGVTEIDPSEYEWRGEQPDRYSIMSYQTTPAGERVIKLMTFNKKTDQLAAIRLFSAVDQRLLALAVIEEYYQDSKTGLQVPRVMRLAWPDAGTEMKVMLGRRSIELNTVTPEDGAALFARSGLSDKEPINMADPRLHQMQEPAPANQRSRSGYATPEPTPRRRRDRDDGIVDLGAPRAIEVRKAGGDQSD